MPKKKEHVRKDGLIERKIVIGQTIDGKPKRKSFYGKSVREIEDKIKDYYKSAQYQEIDNSISLAEWADRWLLAYKKGKVKDISYETTYRQPIEQHIKPYFKDARLAAIKPIDIERFYTEKSSYSFSTLSRLKLCLNGMFEAAIENHLIYENPARRRHLKSTKKAAEKQAYTLKEKNELIKYAKKHKYGTPLVIMLKAGLNRAEVLALKWDDIDFKNKVLNVNMSISEVNGKIYDGDPKTEARKDSIPFDDELKAVLCSIPRKLNCDLLFPNKNGGYLSPHNWTNRNYKSFFADYEAFCAEKKLPAPRRLTSHELRHTFGTHVYETTRDIHITKKMMRHANIQTTSKTYVHEDIDVKREVIDKLSKK